MTENTKNIICAIGATICGVIALSVPSWAEVQIPDGIYPTTVKIINISDVMVIDDVTVTEVTGSDVCGRTYSWYDDADDLFIGDLMALIMIDEYETPDNVYDDLVIDARYVGTADMF